jgi:hypothetical protein
MPMYPYELADGAARWYCSSTSASTERRRADRGRDFSSEKVATGPRELLASFSSVH